MKTDKKIDENLYNEKSLYLLNIRELRDLGRKIGVPAPATLKKQDLVDYILKIVYGEVDVPVRNSFGRPSVREVNINQYLDKIRKKSDVYDELITASFDDIDSIFKVASPDESSKTNNVEQKVFVEDDGRFYLREFAFVESKGDVEVFEDIRKKYKLENFDVVEIISSGKSFKIISINGNIINDTKKLSENLFGRKQVFHYSTKEEIKQDMTEQIKANVGGATVVVFSEQDYLEDGVTYIKADKTLQKEQAYKQIMSLVNICEKFVYDGENIVLVTDEADYIEEVLDMLDEEVSNRTKKHLQTRIDDFLALGNALLVYKEDKNFIYQ